MTKHVIVDENVRKWSKYENVTATVISRQSVTDHLAKPWSICYLFFFANETD